MTSAPKLTKAAQPLLSEDECRAALKDLEDNRAALLFMLEDLEAEHKQIEQAHQEWMAALDVIDNPIFLHDREFRVLRCNKAYQRCAGIPFREIIGQPYYAAFPKAAGPMPGCLRALEEKGAEEEVTAGATIYRSCDFSIKDEQGAYLYSMHILEDITERRESGVRLKLFRALIDNSSDAIEVIDPVTLRLLDFNDEECRELGYSREELLSMSVFDIDPDMSEGSRKMLDEQMRQSGSAQLERMHRRKDGSTFPVEISAKFIKLDEPYILSIARNITNRKLAEKVLARSNRALRTLSEGNQALIHASDEVALLRKMCHVAVEEGGYRMAWVGYVEQDAQRSIRPIAQAGFEEGYLEQAHITWMDNERGRGPTGRAVRSGQTQVAQNIALDPEMAPWRAEASRRGYASSIALPLKENDRCFGVMMMYAAEADAFDAEEIGLLEQMASDLAFGILTLRIRLAHREHEQRLRKNMLQTVEAIAGIVEMRDPYTAGHQNRVADLALAIATQMGLPAEQAHAIHLAGVVHDLGKIHIPAEILSKPGSLSDIEYDFIKTHPQAGYDILKDIDFPWPIAQMVLQHHERIDGSGYPQGLKGEAILLEARILSVADVVEAMSSHRPYRASLGVEAALAEITGKRGIHFDAAVVDACLVLFREKNYALPK